jgi:penicillin-binding protein 1A
MVLTLFGAYALACSFVYVAPSLPSVEVMRNVEMQVPLRVFTTSGELIAQIGEQRRIPVAYEQIPPLVRQAFLAAEDDQFFQHGGVDYLGILRALVVNLVSNDKAQGASTITQQAARNMFLTLDKTWRRKLAELFVTWRMEREFSKEEILGLYLNVIYFGQRAYGVAAASRPSSASRSMSSRCRGRNAGRRSAGAVALQPHYQSRVRAGSSRLCAQPHASSLSSTTRPSSRRRRKT